MEFPEVVRRRRMVRNYDPERPVPPEVVERLLGYAIHAPSAGFSQGWGFLVLAEPADRDAFWASTTDPDDVGSVQSAALLRGGRTNVVPDTWLTGMRRAPLIVVPHSNRDAYLDRYAAPDKGWTDRDEARWPMPFWHIDTGFASLLMLLGAVDEGLGACFFGIPPAHTATFKATFEVPDEFTPIGAITIGYRAPDRLSPSLERGRRPVGDVVHRGRWGSH